MTPEAARAHNRAHGFIDRRTSRSVLKEITRSDRDPPAGLSDCDPDFVALHRRYWEIRKSIPHMECRNFPFYLMIKETYEDFRWHDSDAGVMVDYTYKGLKPSLLSLLMGRVPRHRAETADPLDRLPLAMADELRALFHDIGVVTPTRTDLGAVVDWIERGLAGEPLTIVSPVCPDYAVEPIDEAAGGFGTDGRLKARRHRFTFRDLGTDVGVTAAHLFGALPRLHDVLKTRFGLDVHHLVMPGDFEGFSEETCARLGIDEATFVDRVSIQSGTIADAAPVPVEARPFTTLCGGRAGWFAAWEKALERLTDGDLRDVARQPWVRTVALSRRDLYDRWYDSRGREDDFYVAIAVRQAAEYAAMGAIVAAAPTLANPLVLGADDHKMGRFYRLAAPVPVLYLQRNYE